MGIFDKFNNQETKSKFDLSPYENRFFLKCICITKPLPHMQDKFELGGRYTYEVVITDKGFRRFLVHYNFNINDFKHENFIPFYYPLFKQMFMDSRAYKAQEVGLSPDGYI